MAQCFTEAAPSAELLHYSGRFADPPPPPVFTNPAGRRMLGDGLALANGRLLGAGAERHCLQDAIERMIRGARTEFISRLSIRFGVPLGGLIQRRRKNRVTFETASLKPT